MEYHILDMLQVWRGYVADLVPFTNGGHSIKTNYLMGVINEWGSFRMGIEFELILMNFYEVISKFHSIPFNSLMTPIN